MGKQMLVKSAAILLIYAALIAALWIFRPFLSQHMGAVWFWILTALLAVNCCMFLARLARRWVCPGCQKPLPMMRGIALPRYGTTHCPRCNKEV